jgi:hypothetical protein
MTFSPHPQDWIPPGDYSHLMSYKAPRAAIIVLAVSLVVGCGRGPTEPDPLIGPAVGTTWRGPLNDIHVNGIGVLSVTFTESDSLWGEGSGTWSATFPDTARNSDGRFSYHTGWDASQFTLWLRRPEKPNPRAAFICETRLDIEHSFRALTGVVQGCLGEEVFRRIEVSLIRQ